MSVISTTPQLVNTSEDPGLEYLNQREIEVALTPTENSTKSVVYEEVTQVITNVFQVNAPSGANGQLQFNQNGQYVGDTELQYDPNTDTLTTGSIIANSITITGNASTFKLPGGNNNDVLTTDGTGNLAWANVFPSVSGNTGKFLVTNGVSIDWSSTSYNSLATTTYVSSAIADLVGTAPAMLNTLSEIANVIGQTNDPQYGIISQLANKANISNLAQVAFSGSYSDLSNKPTISTAGTTGNYSDLNGKPTIPTTIMDLGISDGAVGQVLTANGNGTYRFTTVTGGSSYNQDLNTTNNVAFSSVTSSNISSPGNVVINTQNGTFTWNFTSTGALLFPQTPYVTSGIVVNDNNQELSISTDRGSISIWPEGSKWLFGANGNLTLPNSGTINDNSGGAGTPGILINRTLHTPDDTDPQNFGEDTITILLDNSEGIQIETYLAQGIGVKVWFNLGDSYSIISCVKVANGTWTITATGMGDRFSTFETNALIFIYTGSTPNTYTNFPQYVAAGIGATVAITKGNNTWEFGNDGNLTLPAGGDIVDSTGNSVLGRGTTLPANASGYLTNDGAGNLAWAAGDGAFSGNYNDLTNKPTIPEISKTYIDGSTVQSTNLSVAPQEISLTASLNPGFDSFGSSITKVKLDSGAVNISSLDQDFPDTVYKTEINVSYYDGVTITNSPGPNDTKTWIFKNNGQLQLPNGGDIVDSTGNSVLGGGSVTDRLTASGDEVVLIGGVNPYVTFPAISSGDQLIIQGAEVSSVSGQLALTSRDNLNIITNGSGTAPGGSKNWSFNNEGKLILPQGSIVGETANSTVITPPTALAGQSLVIRPTASVWSVTSSGYITYGSPITISVNQNAAGNYFGTVNYEITGTGVTEQSLGRALTGHVVFTGTMGPVAETVTWTIPANSGVTEFTFTLTGVDGTASTGPGETDPALYYNFEWNALPTGAYATVSNNGISNSEASHVHLVAGNPTTTDIYLGDDDQYVKIEKNGGNVVIGTDTNSRQWTFDTNGTTTFPGNLVGSGASPAPSISGFDSISALTFTNGTSNVTINSNSNLWKFGTDGNLTIPGSSGGFIKTVSNASIGIAAVDNGTDNPAQLLSINAGSGAATSIVSAYATNATIQTNATGAINTWKFDNAGNLTLPANTFAVNYANGTQVSLGSGSSSNISNGNSNVRIATANGNVTIASAGNTTMTITGTGANITGTTNITGTSVTGVNSILAGPTFTPLANTMGGFVSNVNSYTQLTIQNKNTGADATTDFIATADNGSDTVNYLDMGIINSGYDALTPTNSLGNIVYAADSYIYAQGNASAVSQSGGNLVLGTTVAGKTVKIFAGGITASNIVATVANTGVTVNGNVTATKFVGDGSSLTNVTVNVAGNITGTSPNVSLVAGSYTMTFDNTGLLSLPTMGGDEGGEINFGIPTSNTTLTTSVKVDVYQNKFRIFDGSTKGVYVDLSQAATGVGTLLNNRVSGFVNAGTFVTMDLIKATVTTTGNRGLSLATTTGTFTYNIGGTYAVSGSGTGGQSFAGQTLTTTATTSIFGWAFAASGDISTYILTDTTNSRCYRITLMMGASFNNNAITIERLI